MFQGCANIITRLASHALRFSFVRVLNIWISTPRGANGCLLKKWVPMRTVHAKTFEWMFENLNRLTCMSSCGSNSPHRPRGKVSANLLRAPMVCAFHVCSARSAIFILCWTFGTTSYSNSFYFMACLNSVEHSLSSTCFLGLITDDLSHCIKLGKSGQFRLMICFAWLLSLLHCRQFHIAS